MSIAFAVLLQHCAESDLQAANLQEQMRRDWPDLDIIITQERTGKAEDQFVLANGGAKVIVTPVSAPFAEDSGELCETSLLWPNEQPFNDNYQANCIVAVEDQVGDERSATVLLTKVMASLIRVSRESFAVYWAAANHLIYPPLFREMSMSILPEPPLYLWVAFNIWERDSGELHALTKGLDRLGLMDIEIPHSRRTAKETHEFTVNLAGYLLQNGLIIQDGDTVGQSETERIQAVYAPSSVDGKTTVIQLQEEFASIR
ncbi:DUF4261 domain-containing protein [Corynebacterium freiburgense]|uniref:DUF4261 domain-containing protein n=1 Tax=Corynebacterium freiburgense TaxID=556548 RepID=UPI00041B5A3F|nr:DUF4261 domain-containing protein [Corynebacterium freiburgense]WJZ01811.1 hypothetical protein CFREI_02535 [Corynebacterium freiburgense]